MEIYEYKDNVFYVTELEDCFKVETNEQVYYLDSLADLHEFIQYYNLEK